MDVIRLDPEHRAHVRQFLELPFRLYRETPQWVPPLAFEVRKVLDPRRHPFYRHSTAAFYLALEGRQVVGRLAVLDNRRYNEFNGEHTAFFYLFECENQPGTAQALFDQAGHWARAQGLERIIGPKGFTPFDGLGMLVKGFEHRPAFGLPYNMAYYPTLVEAAGFHIAGEMVSGYLNARTPLPEKIHRASELIQKRRGLRVARFHTRRDLRSLVPRLQALYNQALSGTSGNVPLTDEETRELANQLLWFADPRLIKIIYKADMPVGFLFAYPDISAALQRCGGKVFPIGWLRLLLELKRTKWININGAGILEKYRGLGGTAILFSEMWNSVLEGGFDHADIVQIGVENDKMQRELRDFGIDFYKIHRLYQKPLE